MKKISQNKRVVIAACLCAALLVGCAPQSESAPTMPPHSATPPPLVSDETFTFTTDVFFLFAGNTLLSEQREITAPNGMTRAEAAIRTLLAGPEHKELSPVANQLSLDRVEISGDVCLVYFSGLASYMRDGRYELYEHDVLKLRAAIAATVQAAQGVQYTDIYLEDVQPGFSYRVQPAYTYRPLGAVRAVASATDVLNMQYPPPGSEENQEENTTEHRFALIYYTDAQKELLLCSVQPIQYTRNTTIDDMLRELFNLMGNVPEGTARMVSALPQSLRYEGATFIAPAELDDTQPIAAPGGSASGAPASPSEQNAKLITSIPSTENKNGYLQIFLTCEEKDFDETLAYASMLYTVTGFLPRLSGMAISINGEDIPAAEQVAVGGDAVVFKRSDFYGMLGNTTTLYYPDLSGKGLRATSVTMPQETVRDVAHLARALIRRLELGDAPKVAPSDIQAVFVQGDLAIIDCKEGFYDAVASWLSALPESTQEQRAKLYIFSLVNTLGIRPGIRRVQFLENGKLIQAPLPGGIMLINPLFCNPGIILS